MFLFCLMFAMSLCASVYMCFVVTCWERADLLALVIVSNCEFVTFPLVWYLIVSISDLCTLTYFYHWYCNIVRAQRVNLPLIPEVAVVTNKSMYSKYG